MVITLQPTLLLPVLKKQRREKRIRESHKLFQA